MSYLHVDAVNQQIPENMLKPVDMLILTKFAEKLRFGHTKLRVNRETFMRITHIRSKNTLREHLIKLHNGGYLLCPQLFEEMHTGDWPRIFTLCLPHGLDENVINARRNKYYGGKPYDMGYDEVVGDESVESGSRLTDVEKASTESKFDRPETKNVRDEPKFDPSGSKTDPYNKETIKKFNNNESVVVDEEVEKFLEAAVQAAGGAKSSFTGIVKNAAEARIGLDAVRYFEEIVVKSGKTIRNSIGFLHHIVEQAIQNGGVTAFTGKISPPKVASESDQLIKALVDVLRKNLTREEFALLSANEKNTFARTVQKRFYVRDGDAYLQVYFEDFLSTYRGDAFASSEELLVTLNDYMNKFIAEKQDYMK